MCRMGCVPVCVLLAVADSLLPPSPVLVGQTVLGKTLVDVTDDLLSAHSKYGIHVLGEGGEFESLAVDAPWLHCGRLHISLDRVERQVSQVQ